MAIRAPPRLVLTVVWALLVVARSFRISVALSSLIHASSTLKHWQTASASTEAKIATLALLRLRHAAARTLFSPRPSTSARTLTSPALAPSTHLVSTPHVERSTSLNHAQVALPNHLARSGPSVAAAFVHKTLDEHKLDNPSRFQLFQFAVSLFLRHGHVMKAAILYARMTREGYIPSISLRTQMHIVKLIDDLPHQPIVLEAVSEAFNSPSFDDDAFYDLLRVLVEGVQVPLQFIDRVVEAYLTTRPAHYHLPIRITSYIVRAHARAGDKLGAVHWSTRPSPPPVRPRSAVSIVSPYTTILRDLANANPSYSVYEHALTQMQKEDPSILPDLPFFNALLAHEVGRRNYDVVFTIYRQMMTHRNSYTTPDAHTFSTVFRALHRLSTETPRQRRRSRKIKDLKDVPDARSVYRDLLLCHKEQQCAQEPTDQQPTGEPPVSPALEPMVLHKAVRAFMARYDYAGAYVALRAFRFYPDVVGKPTLTTYSTVVNAILGRIQMELPRISAEYEPDAIWTYRFLGLEEVPRDLRKSLRFSIEMVHRVLIVGADPRLNLSFVDVPDYTPLVQTGEAPFDPRQSEEVRAPDPDEFHRHGVPAPFEFAGLQAVDDQTRYKVTPLERILKRAILASEGGEVTLHAGLVSKAIGNAKEEMMPR